MAKAISVVILLALALSIYPASAWGPATHVYIADKALDSMQNSELKELLAENKRDYIYGSIAPDLYSLGSSSGPNFGDYREAHSWKAAAIQLKEAVNDSEKAFAIGYMMHLAADSIAHNHYVPYEFRRLGRAGYEMHAAIELTIDEKLLMKQKNFAEDVRSTLALEDNREKRRIVSDRTYAFVTRYMIEDYQQYINNSIDDCMRLLLALSHNPINPFNSTPTIRDIIRRDPAGFQELENARIEIENYSIFKKISIQIKLWIFGLQKMLGMK